MQALAIHVFFKNTNNNSKYLIIWTKIIELPIPEWSSPACIACSIIEKLMMDGISIFKTCIHQWNATIKNMYMCFLVKIARFSSKFS